MMRFLLPAVLAVALLAVCAPTPARAWMLTYVVKDKDGTPQARAYSSVDRQACIGVMNAVQKMDPEAVIVQTCAPQTALGER
jgi:hypothetical protein